MSVTAGTAVGCSSTTTRSKLGCATRTTSRLHSRWLDLAVTGPINSLSLAMERRRGGGGRKTALAAATTISARRNGLNEPSLDQGFDPGPRVWSGLAA